jgi:acetoacetate decarboxylase
MMSFSFEPNKPYFMPTHFGSLPGMPISHYGDLTQFSIIYSTDKDALAGLLPQPFEPADDPVVTVYYQWCKQVNFMAGRGYNIVGVNLAAVFNGKKDHIIGRYAAVLWENDPLPIVIGREQLGAPKLYADIPDPQQEGNNWRFHCSAYGARLVEGEIRNATPADNTVCAQIEKMAKESTWMCWKYIPRIDQTGPDLSFPTAVATRATIREAWLGEGSHKFLETTFEAAPSSAHIMQGLQMLVVKEYRVAAITRGTLELPTADNRIIE